MNESCPDGSGGVDARKVVDDGHTCLHGLSIRFTGNRHEARHALYYVVIARKTGIGTVLAKAGDRAIDEFRVDRPKAFKVKAVFFQTAQLEVFDDDVGCGYQ